MCNEIIASTEAQIPGYDIKVKILCDCYTGLLDITDMAQEVKSDDLSYPVWLSLNDHDATMAIDNDTHDVYTMVKIDRHTKLYYILRDNLKDSVRDIEGYNRESCHSQTKNDMWLDALKHAKSDVKYLQEYFNNYWQFVFILVEVSRVMVDENGLIWTSNLDYDHNSLGGVEWSICSGIISNEEQFKYHIPELLPEEITLTEEQLDNFWKGLE